ncbi:hypothetical protein [Nonomuraea typhae]|uniref:hypothetical protein n=1 Tax=Nonomuraea typhae TaxID=2603600 RepID=UPI0012F8E81C|nr:hypothetical protein [Nonomuraea typhae]
MTTLRRSTMRYLALIPAAALAGLFMITPAHAAPAPPDERQTQSMPGDLLSSLTRGLPIGGLPVS